MADLPYKSMNDLPAEKRDVIHFMHALGWDVVRVKSKRSRHWEFTRQTDIGSADKVSVRQSGLTWDWCMRVCIGNETEFRRMAMEKFHKWRGQVYG